MNEQDRELAREILAECQRLNGIHSNTGGHTFTQYQTHLSHMRFMHDLAAHGHVKPSFRDELEKSRKEWS